MCVNYWHVLVTLELKHVRVILVQLFNVVVLVMIFNDGNDDNCVFLILRSVKRYERSAARFWDH